MRKTLEIIGGPNGSGKTTFAEIYLGKRKDALYVNSDSIARGLTLNGNELAQFEAGRIMLETIEKYLKENSSFAFETTLSGRIWTSYIHRAKEHDYKIVLYFILVNSIPLSLQRIKNRVAHGGHGIARNIVRRRFKKTFSNFMKLYAPLADEWCIIDNSKTKPLIIAQRKNKSEKIFNKNVFRKYFG